MAYCIVFTAIVAIMACFVTYYTKKAIEHKYHDLNFIPIMEKEEYTTLYEALCANLMVDGKSINEIVDLNANEKYESLFKHSESDENDIFFDGEKMIIKNK